MANVVVPLLLARHGETSDNAHGRILGRRDPPLLARRSRAGREAGRAASAWRSGGRDVVPASLLRARQTAASIVADAIGVAPTVLEDLIESDRGSWEGQPVDRGHRGGHARAVRGVRGRARQGFRVPRRGVPGSAGQAHAQGAHDGRGGSESGAGRRPCRDDSRRDDRGRASATAGAVTRPRRGGPAHLARATTTMARQPVALTRRHRTAPRGAARRCGLPLRPGRRTARSAPGRASPASARRRPCRARCSTRRRSCASR